MTRRAGLALNSLEIFHQILWKSDERGIAIVWTWKDEQADKHFGWMCWQVVANRTDSAKFKTVLEMSCSNDKSTIVNDTKIADRRTEGDRCIVNGHRSEESGVIFSFGEGKSLWSVLSSFSWSLFAVIHDLKSEKETKSPTPADSQLQLLDV